MALSFAWLKKTGNQIPLSVLAALLTGFLINKFASNVPTEVTRISGLPGNIWIRALKAIVVPLILTSMISSMQSLKNMPGGGQKIAKYALWYFFITTIIGLLISVVFILVVLAPNMKPIDLEELIRQFPEYAKKQDIKQETILDRTLGIITGIIPENVIKVMAENDLIAVITTGAVIGLLINDTPEQPSVIVRFTKEIERIVTIVVNFLVAVSPVGIFSLIIPPLMSTPIEKIFGFMSWYFLAFFAACFFHLFVFYPFVYFILIRKNPFAYFKHFVPSALTALGTGSSAASMPVTIDCAIKAGIRSDIASFLVPLGVSLNMDGTAIGLPIGVAFMALGLGRALSIVDYCVLVFTGFLATVGAAPIPAASLVFYMMMMSSIGLEMNPLFGLLAATDWLSERPVTVLNVIGDTIALPIAQKYCLQSGVDPGTATAHDAETGKSEKKS